MATDPGQDDNKTELPKKSGNSQKITIVALIVAIAVLVGALLGVMSRNAGEEKKSETTTGAQENVADQSPIANE
jgi:flagellar basal body-associated protein FliL